MGRTAIAVAVMIAAKLAAAAALANEDDQAGTAADYEDDALPGDAPPAPTRIDGRDLPLEAMALEMAGVRHLAVLAVTSEPAGAEVTLEDGTRCTTPCRLTLPPGRYLLVLEHQDRTSMEAMADVSTDESVRVHATLGRRTPPEIIVPLYFVGAIFAAGGISSMALNWSVDPRPIDESDGDADSRRFHRNLGAASVAVGVPLLVLATYLLAAGRPGRVAVSVGPGSSELSIAPVLDEYGQTAGAGIAGSF